MGVATLDMDAALSITISLVSSPVLSSGDVLWDNRTDQWPTGGATGGSRLRQQYLWIGMSFVGGFAAGVLLHYVYFCIRKCVLSSGPSDALAAEGRTNLSFIGGEVELDDRPPEYATVVGGGDCNATTAPKEGFRRWLFFWKRQSSEEPPPPYSTVVLELDLCVRWRPGEDTVHILALDATAHHRN